MASLDATSPFLLRASLARAANAGVDGCYTAAAPGLAPLVACARHKAVAVAAALDALAAHEAAALQRLECYRDAAVAEAEAFIADVRTAFDARFAELRCKADVKRAGLQTEAVAVDIALENAQAVTAALLEVCPRMITVQRTTLCRRRRCRPLLEVTTKRLRCKRQSCLPARGLSVQQLPPFLRFRRQALTSWCGRSLCPSPSANLPRGCSAPSKSPRPLRPRTSTRRTAFTRGPPSAAACRSPLSLQKPHLQLCRLQGPPTAAWHRPLRMHQRVCLQGRPPPRPKPRLPSLCPLRWRPFPETARCLTAVSTQ